MGATNRWAGWVGFAGWLMLIIGAIDCLEGLVAIIRKSYYVLAPSQVIIFDVKTWGWLTLLWGGVVLLTGLALLGGAGWARWLAIIVGSLNFFELLGFVGNAAYPLWALTALGLTGFTLYALIVHWNDAKAEIA